MWRRHLLRKWKNIFNLIMGGGCEILITQYTKNNVTTVFQRVEHLSSPLELPDPSEVFQVPKEDIEETG